MEHTEQHFDERLIKVVCIEYCTSESRYLCEDSHSVQIPEDLFSRVMGTNRDGKPMYVRIVNSRDHSKSIVLGKVEPSVKTFNSDKTMCIIPSWVLQKLNIDSFNGYVDLFIVNYNDVPRPKYIKIKANISSYAGWNDVKERIEERLGQFNCININDTIVIDNVRFTITELKDKNNNDVTFASTFDESDVILDFDMPDDLVEKEKQRKLEDEARKKALAERKLQKATDPISDKKSRDIPEPKQKFHVGGGARVKTFSELKHEEDEDMEKKIDVFATPGYKLSSNPTNYKPTREELARIALERIERMKKEAQSK